MAKTCLLWPSHHCRIRFLLRVIDTAHTIPKKQTQRTAKKWSLPGIEPASPPGFPTPAKKQGLIRGGRRRGACALAAMASPSGITCLDVSIHKVASAHWLSYALIKTEFRTQEDQKKHVCLQEGSTQQTQTGVRGKSSVRTPGSNSRL